MCDNRSFYIKWPQDMVLGALNLTDVREMLSFNNVILMINNLMWQLWGSVPCSAVRGADAPRNHHHPSTKNTAGTFLRYIYIHNLYILKTSLFTYKPTNPGNQRKIPQNQCHETAQIQRRMPT